MATVLQSILASLGVALARMSAKVRRRLAALGVISATALAFSLLAAPVPALAADYYASTVTTTNINVRPCVNTSDGKCAPVASSGGATRARMTCYRDGSWATGRYSSNRWFLVELNTPGGPEGFVHSSFIINQTGVPECGTLARVRAVDWTLTQVAQTMAPAEYGQGTWGMDWRPGPNREWSGDCAKLPFIAYRRQGMNYPLANAIDQWNALPSKGYASSGYYPRYGDPVFWNIASPYGHTALYIGGDKVVGTRGMDGDWRPVEIYPIGAYGNYLGYARFA